MWVASNLVEDFYYFCQGGVPSLVVDGAQLLEPLFWVRDFFGCSQKTLNTFFRRSQKLVVVDRKLHRLEAHRFEYSVLLAGLQA